MAETTNAAGRTDEAFGLAARSPLMAIYWTVSGPVEVHAGASGACSAGATGVRRRPRSASEGWALARRRLASA